MTRRHTVVACRGRPNKPRRALPRCRALHPLADGRRVMLAEALAGCQRGICHELLCECQSRASRVAPKLVGHPPRKRHIKAVDNGHNVIRHTDRFIGHVRIIRTQKLPTTPSPSIARGTQYCRADLFPVGSLVHPLVVGASYQMATGWVCWCLRMRPSLVTSCHPDSMAVA